MDSFIVQLSGQLQHATIQLRDQLGDELNGDHEYLRFNPALGFVWKTNQNMNIYGNYSVSARTPTPVELTCADPDAPCRLPNAFLSDPPLKQAVARTTEFGARFHKEKLEVTATFFRTLVQDDIYFISAGASRNTGYFSNIGNTLRTGVEIGGQYRAKNWEVYANYTWLNATFQEDFTINSPFHPEAIDGEIDVKKGNRLPLAPNHIAKMGVSYRFAAWNFGAQCLFNGAQVVRGDESNTLDKVKSYSIGNIYASCRLTPKMMLTARADNIWNQRYETFGLLGEANTLPTFEKFNQPFFLTPGAPISVSVGMKFLL
jgi:outer membrane receptor protein involved in Fe transport